MEGDHIPEAYKIGWVPFYTAKIWLDSHPLIPRVETEYWTELLAQHIGATNSRVLDLCAGSGAIGVAIAKHCPSAYVSFGEIDPAHLMTIWKNIRENKIDRSRVDVKIGDLFEPFAELHFDFIATNPPYIPTDRKLSSEVARHEPELALRAGARGLAVIERIIAKLPAHLSKVGEAWIECDVENIDEAKALAEMAGFKTRILQDQYERPRVVILSR